MRNRAVEVPESERWVVIVPQKDLRRSKSRMGLPATDRRILCEAMVRDTVEAVLASTAVTQVIVVCDTEDDASDFRELGIRITVTVAEGGMNAAVDTGACLARALRPESNVAALPGDLPALRPGELSYALSLALGNQRSFVTDIEGGGTTLLTATAGGPLLPEFGGSSRARHAFSGATELRHGGHCTSLQSDVDDLAGLSRALKLGCGAFTRRAIAGSLSGLDDVFESGGAMMPSSETTLSCYSGSSTEGRRGGDGQECRASSTDRTPAKPRAVARFGHRDSASQRIGVQHGRA